MSFGSHFATRGFHAAAANNAILNVTNGTVTIDNPSNTTFFFGLIACLAFFGYAIPQTLGARDFYKKCFARKGWSNWLLQTQTFEWIGAVMRILLATAAFNFIYTQDYELEDGNTVCVAIFALFIIKQLLACTWRSLFFNNHYTHTGLYLGVAVAALTALLFVANLGLICYQHTIGGDLGWTIGFMVFLTLWRLFLLGCNINIVYCFTVTGIPLPVETKSSKNSV